MKTINWNDEKNLALKESRAVCFEDVVFYIERSEILDDYAHPNQKAYSGQCIMVIDINNYAYLVPYVEDEEEIFLKTIIPSRKATQKYLGENNED
ncbi:MAG TPA: toxin [Smithella sp.]|jgi:hypothetical protein|nr:toxin [Smithella sp.]